MKNLVVLVATFSLLSISACSQKNLPENVKKEFSIKYPVAQSIKWDSETANEWEAEFSLDSKKMSACFDNSWKWINSETEIPEKELPEAVLNTMNKDFQGYKRRLSEIFESPELKGFEVTLIKGESSLEVIFDNNGNIIKKTNVSEEDEENEKSG